MRTLIVTVVTGGMLAACVGAPDTTSRASAEGQTVLTVLLADDWAGTPAVTGAIQSFEQAHEGVRVEVRGLPFPQIEEAVTADLRGQQDIDVAQWHAFAAAARGEAEPVTDRFAEAFPDGTFVPGAIEDVRWAGEIYGVPLDVNALVLLVNDTLLEQIGGTREDLRTFEGIRALAGAIVDTDPSGETKVTAIANSTWGAYGWVRANGGEVIEVDEDGARLTLDTPEVVGAMNFLAGLTAGEVHAYQPFANDVSVDGYTVFREGLTLVHATGSWDAIRLVLDEPEFEWSVAPLPTGPDADADAGTALGGSSLFFPPSVDDLDLAFAFAEHFTSPDNVLRYAREAGRLPPRPEVLADPFFDSPAFRTVVDVLVEAHPMRLIASANANDEFAKVLTEVVNGRVDDAGPLLTEAQARVEDEVRNLERSP